MLYICIISPLSLTHTHLRIYTNAIIVKYIVKHQSNNVQICVNGD